MPEPEDAQTAEAAQFNEAMFEVYRLAKSEGGYNATRFLEMVSSEGGLETARRLLASPTVSDGFTALWEAGRLDLTVEAVVLRPEFQGLFSQDELEVAASRVGRDLGLMNASSSPRLPPDTLASSPVVNGSDPDVEAGDSAEQREAEGVLLAILATRLGVALAPRRFGADEGLRTDVDGFSPSPPVVVEVWAHIGPPKSAQKHKVMTDALKLVWIDRRFLGGQARKIILFADSLAVGHFQRRSWMAAALRDLGIELLVEELPAEVRAQVVAAQARQYR